MHHRQGFEQTHPSERDMYFSSLPQQQDIKSESEKPKKPKKVKHEDDDDKRRRFLERNRQAASKCRQKKKMWMQELEQKSAEVFARNRDLMMLTTTLQEQIAHLEQELAAAKSGCTCQHK
ncbi:hypothetical protein EDD86DRAFT_199995 [Gorgonomyces haynaldii]|nr:hypothetical protein EDD86DRAFT_199995 [Gorgonomyces haynaldii]